MSNAHVATDRGTSGGIEMGLDDFLTHEAGGGNGFFANWRKDGKATVWLHKTLWATLFINHGWPRVVERTDKETKEKTLKVWGGRWGCHEREVIHAKQNLRSKETRAREYPVERCPLCMLVDLAVENLRRGVWSIAQPIFEFKGSDPAETLVITAGGICNRYGAKDLSDAEKRAIRAARVAVDETFRENLKSKGAYLFCVADDANPEAGLQKTFEGDALAMALKKAVKDEMVKAEASRRSRETADPTKTPYPFLWTYDQKKHFNDRYNVVALAGGAKPSDAILEVIETPLEQVRELIERDVQKGNCFSLRASMEAHLVPGVVLPWDRLFGPAEKAGLMVAPPESKDDVEGDVTDFEPAVFASGGDAFERGGAPLVYDVQGGAAPAEIVKVPADHPVWIDPRPQGQVELSKLLKGKEALLDAPDSADDGLVQKVTAACLAAGAVAVGELVPCDHCGEGMSTLDNACPSCGAQVNEQGKLISRPCLKVDCKGQVPYSDQTAREPSICPVCGTLHAVGNEEPLVWAVMVPEPAPAPAPAAPARRGRRAPAGAPPFAT